MGKIYDRKSKEYIDDKQQGSKILKFLYGNVVGRILLKIAILPLSSKLAGMYYDSQISSFKIDDFIEENNIDMSLYEDEKYNSFNDFFTRKKKINNKILSNYGNKSLLISPADAKVLCYKMYDGLKVNIKDSTYDIRQLVKRKEDVLKKFENGNVLIFRLSVDDYHRYCYVDDGELIENYEINGKLHTVSSFSKDYQVYKENHRIINLLHSKHFGDMYYIEVGALLVGKIINHNLKTFNKGEEKGFFKYGGSTIVIITRDNIEIDEDIVKNSEKNIETKVEYGEKIGILKEN